MLVDLEPQGIVESYGMLSPELAVGFRAARAARDWFDGLEHVAVSVQNSTGAATALRNMMNEDTVSIHDHGRHAYVFCHLPTGSVLHLRLRPGVFDMPPCCTAAENALLADRHVPERLMRTYGAQVDALIGRVLGSPLEDVFSVCRHRCRPAARSVDELCRFRRCDRCGADVRLNRLYCVEGFTLCAPCAGVEPWWFHTGAHVGGGAREDGARSGSVRRPRRSGTTPSAS